MLMMMTTMMMTMTMTMMMDNDDYDDNDVDDVDETDNYDDDDEDDEVMMMMMITMSRDAFHLDREEWVVWVAHIPHQYIRPCFRLYLAMYQLIQFYVKLDCY